MTDDEILAAARKAYREMGIKPIIRKFYDCDPPRACIVTAAGFGRPNGNVDRPVIHGYVSAAIALGRSDDWVQGCAVAWDGFHAANVATEYYRAGYAFGLRCREEFADIMPGKE